MSKNIDRVILARAIEWLAQEYGISPEKVIRRLEDDAEMEYIDNAIKSREEALQE